jgi:hypothetical protein
VPHSSLHNMELEHRAGPCLSAYQAETLPVVDSDVRARLSATQAAKCALPISGASRGYTQVIDTHGGES